MDNITFLAIFEKISYVCELDSVTVLQGNVQ